jgi:hypothetical protein
MSRPILEQGEGYPFSVNTFWMGDREGVQVTFLSDKGYVHLERDRAIEVFKKIVMRLEEQEKSDKKDPPWWSTL